MKRSTVQLFLVSTLCLPCVGASIEGALLLGSVGGEPASNEPAGPGGITLDLVDVEVRDALRLVGRHAGVNMVISNRVTGSVTLGLDGVGLEQTLDALADIAGFRYSLEGSVVTVTTVEEYLEQHERDQQLAAARAAANPDRDVLVVALRYVDAERVFSIVEDLVGSDGSVSLLETSDHVAQRYGSGAAVPPAGAESALQIGTQLSASSQGLPARSHTLVVSAAPARLARVRDVVARLDVRPVQVQIEARFVEVALDDTRKLGIDWNVVASGSGAATPHTFPLGDSSLGSFDPNVTGVSGGGVFPEAPSSVTTPGAPGLFTFGTLDFTAFNAILSMIESDARVQVVSNPSIVVGDRHTATILVGERYPILSANISEFGTVTEELVRYEPIGVQLEVSPSVLGEDEIELFVRPSTSSLGPLVTGSTGLSVARINSRQIDTSITIRDRQTLVLGGLFSSREVDEETRVPVLGAIPVLGRLFRSNAKGVERVDLVVFLTVSIVQDDGLTPEQRALFDESTSPSGLFPTPSAEGLGYVAPQPRF